MRQAPPRLHVEGHLVHQHLLPQVGGVAVQVWEEVLVFVAGQQGTVDLLQTLVSLREW